MLQPKTLIQIHYHNRPGGVTTVMNHYATAFTQIQGDQKHENILLCAVHPSNQETNSNVRLINVNELDYQSFTTKKSYVNFKKKIVQIIQKILDTSSISGAICIIVHNMSLGKNCALSSAITHVAKCMNLSKREVSFFSVIHDFAEEGRVALLEQIKQVADFGIPIWKDLYPSSSNFRYVSINKQSYSLLKKASFPVSLLPNPLTAACNPARFKISSVARYQKEIFTNAQSFGYALDPEKPTIFYPSRFISRKNPVEAIMLSHFYCNANILFGSYGTAKADVFLAKKIEKLCAKKNVPVVVNSEKLLHRQGLASVNFSQLYDFADCCISTSVSEGFGYSLYEPIIHGKGVLGRLPQGFLPSVSFDNCFYKQLFIPCSWVNIPYIQRKYYDRCKRIGNGISIPLFSVFKKQFENSYISDDGIDFGCLDISTQYMLFKQCLVKPAMVTAWQQMFSTQTEALMKSFVNACLIKAKNSLGKKTLVHPVKIAKEDDLSQKFETCFLRRYNVHASAPDPQIIKTHFAQPGHFKLLMNPESPDIKVNRTIFA